MVECSYQIMPQLVLGKPIVTKIPTTTRAPIILEKKKKSKKAAIKFIGATTAILGVAAAFIPFVGPALAVPLIGAGVTTFLAPTTVERIVSIPGAPAVIVASAAGGPVAGLAVAAEEGVSILGGILGTVPEKIKEYGPEILTAAGGLAVGGAVGSGLVGETIKKIKDRKKIKREPENGMLGEAPAPVAVAAPAVGALGTAPLPMETQELGKVATGKRRKRRQEPRISQSVRVNIINSNKYLKQLCYA